MEEYKKIMSQLYEELNQTKQFEKMKYTQKNYIQFPIKSSYGLHFELWLTDTPKQPTCIKREIAY